MHTHTHTYMIHVCMYMFMYVLVLNWELGKNLECECMECGSVELSCAVLILII